MATGSVNSTQSDVEDQEQKTRIVRQALYNSYGSMPDVTSSGFYRSSSFADTSITSVRLPEDELVCCGIMSPVRRTFCLLLLFDFILTFILWIIYSQTSGDPLLHSLYTQVIHFTFSESLFDTVLCAAVRFIPCLLAYGLWKLNQPWAIALTTAATCAFLLAKVFVFDFGRVHNNIMCYFLLIISFIIAWIETWFLDFKVLPREQKARERAAFYQSISERTPILSDVAGQHNWNAGEEYYSPAESEASEDERSIDDFNSLPGTRGHSRAGSRSSNSLNLSLGTKEQEYLRIAQDVWDVAWMMGQTHDGWKLEAGSENLVNGGVHLRKFENIGKVYRLQGFINCSPKVLYEEMVYRCSDTPRWNPTIVDCKVVQIIDEHTDIMYNAAAESAGGLVSSRDFVNIRRYGQRDGVYVSTGRSVDHPLVPPSKQHVRGENGPGLWMFKAVPGRPNKTILISIINTDLKGWLPGKIVDQALGGVLLAYLKYVRSHVGNVVQRI